MRFPQLDVVDRGWRRRLTALPFRARQSSRNGPVRQGQRFSEDRLRALLAEGGDAMQLQPPPDVQPLPSELRNRFHGLTKEAVHKADLIDKVNSEN